MFQKDLWIFVAICFVFVWFSKRWRDRRHILLCTKFTTIWAHVITGFGVILTSKGTIKTINDTIKKYGKNIVCYVGPYPILLTIDPVLIKDVLNAKQCTSKPAYYTRMSNAFGRGLITLSDPHWINERKIVNTAFSNKNLMSFIPIFNKEVNRLLQIIDKDIDENCNTSLLLHFREFTVCIATRTTIGRKIDKTAFSSKIISTNSIHGIPTKRGVDPSYENNITTVIEYMAKGVKQDRMQPEHVAGDVLHLFLGAFETTSTTLFFIVIMLGMHPECQQQAYEEVCNIFPDDDDEKFEVTYEHIGQMVYLDMVLNETMRVLPIVPLVGRQVVDHDLTLSNGVVLPLGQWVVIDIFSLHRCKEIWGPDANKFNPYNFLPANIESKHPFSFIPFTKGQRFCVGWRYAQLSIKLAMSKLIKRYKFTANCKLDDLYLENHITSQLRVEPKLILERRKKPKSL